MKHDEPLIVLPSELSDETAYQLLDFLQSGTHVFLCLRCENETRSTEASEHHRQLTSDCNEENPK